MTEPYRPIACSLHDELEALATLRHECEIRFVADHEGEAGRSDATEGTGTTGESDTSERIETDDSGYAVARGRIVDVYSRGGAEYLRLEDGTVIRLDRIVSVNGKPFQTMC